MDFTTVLGSGYWTNLSDETSAYLTLDQSHVGASIRAEISFTDGHGTSETVYSAVNKNY